MLLGFKWEKLALFGALAGAGTTWLLGFISKILSMIPGITVDLQAISITTTGLGGVFGTGLGVYAKKVFTTIGVGAPELLYTAIGGALFVLLGAWIVDKVKFLQDLGRTRETKLAVVLVVAGLISGWILAQSVTIPAISAMVIMAVNALILSYILVWIDKTAKLGIVP